MSNRVIEVIKDIEGILKTKNKQEQLIFLNKVESFLISELERGKEYEQERYKSRVK